MTERDELREKIVDILRVAAAIGPHAVEGEGRLSKLATDFLALIPPQPKLEWRGRFLFVGDSEFQVGEVIAHTDDKWDGFLSADVLVAEYVPSEPVARSAVERAVKEALGWPK